MTCRALLLANSPPIEDSNEKRFETIRNAKEMKSMPSLIYVEKEEPGLTGRAAIRMFLLQRREQTICMTSQVAIPPSTELWFQDGLSHPGS